MFKAPKIGKGVSSVKKKSSLLGKKAGRKSVYGAAPKGSIKGRNILKGTGKKIGPIRPDLKQGGVRKVNRLVETKVQNLVPKLSEKIEQKVDSFDPNKFLGKIFDGGLNSLNQFGSSLDGMKGSVQGTVDFLARASSLASKFITKLASAKGGGGGGLFKNIIKGLAIGGVAALAASVVTPVAMLAAGAVAGKTLWKKGTDFIGGFFKKRKKKKEEEKESKVKKDKSNLFTGILDQFGKTLDFLNKGSKKKEIVGKPGGQDDSQVQPQEGVSGLKASAATIQEVASGEMIIRTAPKSNWREGTVDEPGPRASDEMQSLLTQQEKAKSDLGDYVPGELGNKDPKYLELNARVDEIAALIKAQEEKEGKVTPVKSEVKGDDVIPKGEKGEKGKDGVKGQKGGLGSFLNQSKSVVKNVAGAVFNAHPAVAGFKYAAKGIKQKRQGFSKWREQQSQKKGFWGKLGGLAEGAGRIAGLGPIIDMAKGLKEESADKISQPVGGGKKGEAGVVPIKIPAGGSKQGSPTPSAASKNISLQEEMKNKPPSLIAMDRRNLHVPYSKSTFNIVDAM